MNDQLQELYHKFDGADEQANARLAWYGQCRAKEMTHSEAIKDTYNHYRLWCNRIWPKRNIPLPE